LVAEELGVHFYTVVSKCSFPAAPSPRDLVRHGHKDDAAYFMTSRSHCILEMRNPSSMFINIFVLTQRRPIHNAWD
jgi:hypothetical protein